MACVTSKSSVIILLCAAILWLGFASPISAQQTNSVVVPPLVAFTGTLTGLNAKPLTTVVGVTFALYKDSEGGAPLWLETQNVYPDKSGHYTVNLGSTTSTGLPSDIFVAGEARWLGVQPEGQPEQPRVLLLSVPYALKAVDAQTVGGLPASAFVLAAPSASNTAIANSTAASSMATGSTPVTTAGGTINMLPKFDAAADITNSQIFDNGTDVGVGTTTPAAKLDIKGTATVRGLFSLPATGTATASKGANSQPISFTASAFSSTTSAAVNQNFRWQAEPTGNDTSTPSGTLNLLFGSGTTTPAETGLHIASNGLITFASGQTFPGAGSGTVTSVATGLGLTGGPITTTGTLAIDPTVVPQINFANTFTGNQTVNGNLSATGLVTGTAFNIGSNLFDSGSYANFNASLGFGGNTSMTGTANTASGYQALFADTTGMGNTANGTYALYANTTGSYNVGFGGGTLYANVSGMRNTATGGRALYSSTTSDNTANGHAALYSLTTGYSNTAVGSQAMYYTLTGSNDTAIGYDAAFDQTYTGLTNATAIGAYSDVTQNNSLVLGCVNGVNSCPAAVNVGIGTTSPQYMLDVQGTGNFTGLVNFSPTQVFPNTISGVTAGTGLTGGGTSGNVTLNLNTALIPQLGTSNIFTGNQTVNGNVSATGVVTGSSFQIGTSLFAWGSISGWDAFDGFAGNAANTGQYVTGSGVGALAANTSGSQNSALGADALLNNTTGSYNTAIGSFSLYYNTSGSTNTGAGAGALNKNTTGGGNTATGNGALAVNTTANLNTATGASALANNTTGGGNTGTGYEALVSNTTGYENTALGNSALYYNTTGINNSALGYLAGPDSKSTSLTNSTAIGALAVVSESNALVLGCTNGVNGCSTAVNVGIGTTTPAYNLDVHGTGNFTGQVTFASSQTFPNTISGVTAGTGLTGGGTTGNVTLNLNTALIPELGTANTFTGAETFQNNVTVSASSGQAITAYGNAAGVYAQGSTGVFAYGTGSNSIGLEANGSAYGLQAQATASTSTAITANGGETGLSSIGGITGAVGSGTAYGLAGYGTGTSTGSIGAFGSGPTGVYGITNTTGGYGVYGNDQTSAGAYALYGTSNAGTAVYGTSNSALGYGVYGISTSTASNTSGSGVYGSGYNYGVYGSVCNTLQCAGDGVYGTGPVGVYGNGSGYGVYGVSSGAQGYAIGVEGFASATNAIGVDGDASGTSSIGVYGSGAAYGVYGYTDSTSAPAVYGYNLETSGVAGYFKGNMTVTGAITAGTKDFKIDHPLDPANKYLYHASVESSEMMDIYTGNVTTDAEGNATVSLPDWFEALNADFRYQLTVIGQFAQAIVGSEIANHHFEIKTDKPNVKVSWQVTAVRQDAFAKAHPLILEVPKTGDERGKYLHPVEHGQSEAMGIEESRFAKVLNAREQHRKPLAPSEPPQPPAPGSMPRPSVPPIPPSQPPVHHAALQPPRASVQ